MSSMSLSASFFHAVCLGVLAGAALPAQASRPSAPAGPKKDEHKIEMDALARATLDRWEKMEYHLGRAGVKTVSFKVEVESEGLLGSAKATGTYTFSGTKGKLKWSDATVGGMLAQRGWSAESLDRLFIPDSHRRALANTKLTGQKKGDEVVLTVTGKTAMGFKSFHYDKNGVATKFTMAVDSPATGKVDAVVAVQYQKLGSWHVRTGWTVELDLPMGKFVGTVEVENKKVGKYHVYGAVTETQVMGDQPIGTTKLVFNDYKINGITEPKKPKAKTADGKKAGAGKDGTKKKDTEKKDEDGAGKNKDAKPTSEPAETGAGKAGPPTEVDKKGPAR